MCATVCVCCLQIRPWSVLKAAVMMGAIKLPTETPVKRGVLLVLRCTCIEGVFATKHVVAVEGAEVHLGCNLFHVSVHPPLVQWRASLWRVWAHLWGTVVCRWSTVGPSPRMRRWARCERSAPVTASEASAAGWAACLEVMGPQSTCVCIAPTLDQGLHFSRVDDAPRRWLLRFL